MNAPVPAPSVVFEFEVVGFSDVLQQIPRAVTAAPPSAVTLLSEQVAVVVVIAPIAPVVTEGATFSCSVVKVLCSPYDVSTEFVA